MKTITDNLTINTLEEKVRNNRIKMYGCGLRMNEDRIPVNVGSSHSFETFLRMSYKFFC